MKFMTDWLGDSLIVTNKYIICDEMFGASIKTVNNATWINAVEVDKWQLNSFLPYEDIKELLQYSDDYVNGQIEKYMNMMVFG